MPLERVPESIADVMVERLFDDDTPRSWDSILYPGCGDGALVDAVRRFCGSNGPAAGLPEGVAIDTDAGKLADLERRFDGAIETITADFLTRNFTVDGEFDYVVCNPPTVPWDDLPFEARREYAANFPRLLAGDEAVNEELLFFEHAIRHLAPDGRAAIITTPAFKSAESGARFRDYNFYRVEDIVAFTPDGYPELDGRYLLSVIANDASEQGPVPSRYEAAEYEEMLADRVQTDRPFVASAVMTESPSGYRPDRSIAYVFLDLLYHDYEAAPVYRDPDTKTGVMGFVSREHIRERHGETAADQLVEMTDQFLLSADTALAAVIDRLEDERFQFVGKPDDVVGIITRFDLNREPFYLHLFDCFSDFEIGLRKLIRREAPDWEDTSGVRIHAQREEQLFADRLACGTLGDLIDIVESEGLERSIRTDLTGYDTTLGDLRKLRGAVAHYNPIVHTMGGSPTADTVERGAAQLAREYRFLDACVEGLAE